jgi:hypothetical protein
VPLEVCHKLVVIAVLLLPPVAFWLLARRDGLSRSVAVVATVLHLFLPGIWLAGGPDELLRGGLWPNVLASYLVLFVILWSGEFVSSGRRIAGALTITTIAAAVYINPRSMIGLGTALVAVILAVVLPRLMDRRQPHVAVDTSVVVRRVVWVGAVAALLSAALVLPLRAHQHLYHFEHFVEFSSLRDLWWYYRDAAPPEVIALAAFGVVVGAFSRGLYTRAVAIYLPLACLTLAIVGWLLRDLGVFSQLEGPRLMPMLRTPTIFLAAFGLHELSARLLRGLWVSRSWQPGVLAVGVVVVTIVSPVSVLSEDERGLPPIETTDQPAFAGIARSAAVFDAVAAPGDRPLVIGSPLSIHASFWISARTGRNAWHVDWVWYWREVAGANRTQLADWSSGLSPAFLQRHGLTLVMIDAGFDEMIELAETIPYLTLLDEGEGRGYAIYRVEPPAGPTNGWVSFEGGEVLEVSAERESITARVRAATATTAMVHVNDFPGWTARVNGEAVPIERNADGYMLVDVPAGDATIVLTYETQPVVWLGRGLVVIGLVLLAGMFLPQRVTERVLRRQRRPEPEGERA